MKKINEIKVNYPIWYQNLPQSYSNLDSVVLPYRQLYNNNDIELRLYILTFAVSGFSTGLPCQLNRGKNSLQQMVLRQEDIYPYLPHTIYKHSLKIVYMPKYKS